MEDDFLLDLMVPHNIRPVPENQPHMVGDYICDCCDDNKLHHLVCNPCSNPCRLLCLFVSLGYIFDCPICYLGFSDLKIILSMCGGHLDVSDNNLCQCVFRLLCLDLAFFYSYIRSFSDWDRFRSVCVFYLFLIFSDFYLLLV